MKQHFGHTINPSLPHYNRNSEIGIWELNALLTKQADEVNGIECLYFKPAVMIPAVCINEL